MQQKFFVSATLTYILGLFVIALSRILSIAAQLMQTT